MKVDLYTRLGNEIERLGILADDEQPVPTQQIQGITTLLREAQERLYDVDPTVTAVDYGEPDPAEHDRVAAALEEGGTIREGAKVLGVSRERLKHLLVQHRVEWPRKRSTQEGAPC